MKKEFHQLLIRVEYEAAQDMKRIAAYEDSSVSELVREMVDGFIKDKRRFKAYRELLEAGK
jgi:hypothetical protein